ncbi:DUF4148 domain-containing protein [Paraburkholderia sediminicola]|uniref:DUF4148 domain-containing protein n=1 Tax=Paraburkholderia sediminicola TaxID=458836 RepID=UPI0038B82968
MKRIITSRILRGVFAAPVVAKTDTSGLMRAQVRAELVQLQQSGYRLDSEASYPRSLEAAENTLNHSQVTSTATSESYGGVQTGTVNFGRPVKFEPQAIYFGGS